MKTKSIVLGLSALTLAAGSAFATLLIPNYEIHVLRQTPQGQVWECLPIEATCDGSLFTCKATVNGNPTNIYELDSDCTDRVLNQSTNSVAAVIDPTLVGQDPYTP